MNSIKKSRKLSKRNKKETQHYKAGVFAGADAVKDLVCETLNAGAPLETTLLSALDIEADNKGFFTYQRNKGFTPIEKQETKKDKGMQYYELRIKPSPGLTLDKPTFKRITNSEALDLSRDVFAVKGKRFKVGQKVKVSSLYSKDELEKPK